jgi:arylsulfatase A-like enzyme
MNPLLKRTTLSLAIASCLALSPISQALAAAAAGEKPNFVTIMLDDMGYSDIGVYGGEIDTPNMDALASKSTRLSQFYSAPTSTPARAMFFTGKINHKVGYGNMAGFLPNRPGQQGKPGYEGTFSKEVKTFPELLQSSGYRTIMTGKWDLGEKPGEYASDRGFDNSLVLLPGGDMHYISDANGKLLTSQPPSYFRPLNLTSPYNQDGRELTTFPPNTFSTEFFTNTAKDYLNQWVAEGKTQPFYLNIAHLAPHAPFQAPKELIEKYLPLYQQGWDKIREARFNKQKQLGLIPATLALPPRPPEVPAWDSLTAQQKAVEARRMATYAGLMEMLDKSVGDLITYLQQIGEYEKTAFFIFSDNGAAAIESGSPAKVTHINANFTKDNYENLDNIGSATSFVPPSEGWGMVSNTPFNRFKAETFEGGMHTASFIHYPGITDKTPNGANYDCVTSVLDIAPTILDMAGVTYPTTEPPMDGISMANLFSGAAIPTSCEGSAAERALAFELDGVIMVRKGDWKLAQQWDTARERWDATVYMFNLKNDPAEQNNLAWTYPAKFLELKGIYDQFAATNQVVPVSMRILGSAAVLDVMNNFSQPSATLINGGTQVNYASMLHNRVSTAKLGDTIDVAADIYPAAEHVGKKGDVLVVASYTPDATQAPILLTFSGYGMPNSGFGVSIWDGTVQNLPPFMSFDGRYLPPSLPKMIEVPIYEGKAVMPGKLDFWVGYRLQDGTLVSNVAKTVELTITP